VLEDMSDLLLFSIMSSGLLLWCRLIMVVVVLLLIVSGR